MEWIIVASVAALCTFTTMLCIAILVARHRLHRRHRVDPAVATDAPLTWLVDPRTPARLHRRLARVGTTTTAVADDHRPASRRFRKVEPSPLLATAQDVRAQAVLLDRQLNRLAVLAPGARRRPLIELDRSIAELETATARLVSLSTHVRAPRGLDTDDTGLADITARVDRLAQAHQELLDLDRQNGLLADPLPAPPLTSPGDLPPPPVPRTSRLGPAAPADRRVAPSATPRTSPPPPTPQTWPPTPQR